MIFLSRFSIVLSSSVAMNESVKLVSFFIGILRTDGSDYEADIP
jgi:hypothetical protein